MKLYYTSVEQNLTAYLVKQAQHFADAGKRVFYIAPNSLSFEKERTVLEGLPQQASFRITVTRFAQMARYFVLNNVSTKKTMDNTGLSMVFYHVLSQFSDNELQVYGRLRKDSAFIKQLVELFQELKTANLTILDLQHLGDAKAEDLCKIFGAASDWLNRHQIENQSKLALFASQIENGYLDEELADTVLIIDGFTRFSAEEDYLISLLAERCHDIVIGTYASQKAYQSNFIQGNVYQAPVEFLRHLANDYAVKPIYVENKGNPSNFSHFSQFWEGLHDFKPLEGHWQAVHPSSLEIWQASNQKEEVEVVARKIRQLLADGVRYKDILVLLGDVESYQLQISQLFKKFDIPYYFGKGETMASHPLVHFVDSLERIKRYNYRAEDVLNLLKTGLYGQFTEMEVDRFAHYVAYADIKGRSRFARDFTANHAGKYDLVPINQIRKRMIEPLENFLSARPQQGLSLLDKLSQFLNAISLSTNMEQLASGASVEEMEKHEQVWKVFSDLLLQMAAIFSQDKLAVDDFLALLRSGMLAADYRTIPATVDVVNIKSYDLVEPHTAPYIFAIGMSQSHFPKTAQNKSLLTDEERQSINEKVGKFSSFEILSADNVKKNHFVALSLLNAAHQSLVLSYPQVANEGEEELSVYLKEWIELGVPKIDKTKEYLTASGDQIGHYKDLLSTVIAVNQLDWDHRWTKENQTFWSVAVRYLRKRLSEDGLTIPHILDEVTTSKVSDEVMQIRFPEDKPLHLSVSGLTTFYNNQYLYFLNYILQLQELDSIHPDHRHHGMYLHRIFELALQEDGQDFDKRLEQAIIQTSQDKHYQTLYQQDEESRFSQAILNDIARSTATVLRNNRAIRVASQEEKFKLILQNTVQISGIIDRVDRLSDGSLGVVDYKSGANQFDISKFYNGLNSQLVTYLEALRSQYGASVDQLFGAMYLHMQEPKLDLKTAKSFEDLSQQASGELVYKGLFSEQEKQFLAEGAYHLNNATYSVDEIETLLNYNEELYLDAAQTIRSGKFLINPYTTDGRSVQGEQIKSITHFEADRHMGAARRLLKLPSRGKKAAYLDLMKGGETEN